MEPTWYTDDDGDGDGNSLQPHTTCDPEPGWTLDRSDCRPGDALAYTGAAERCNEDDDDGDREVDEGMDADGDGHRTTERADGTDCDDADPAVNPDAPVDACEDALALPRLRGASHPAMRGDGPGEPADPEGARARDRAAVTRVSFARSGGRAEDAGPEGDRVDFRDEAAARDGSTRGKGVAGRRGGRQDVGVLSAEPVHVACPLAIFDVARRNNVPVCVHWQIGAVNGPTTPHPSPSSAAQNFGHLIEILDDFGEGGPCSDGTSEFGGAVAFAGDTNGDGMPDVVVGSASLWVVRGGRLSLR